jgi:hypothetical protein
VADVVKFELLRQARSGSLPDVASVGVEVDGGTVTFRTRTSRSHSDPIEDLPIERFLCDHSGVSTEVRAAGRRGVLFAIGPHGVHDFPVLNELLRRHPGLVEQALGQK